MKWRDWAVEEYGARKFGNTLIDVWIKTDHDLQGPEFASLAKPRHYEIAAALCKLKGKRDERYRT